MGASSSNDIFIVKFNQNIPVEIIKKTSRPQILLMPNPSKGQFIISILGLESEEYFLELYDAAGKRVYANYHYYTGQTIDISSIARGMYFIHISNSNELSSIHKIIKL